MKTPESEMENGRWQTRSVLECGSPLPLLKGEKHTIAFQSAGRPAQSKTWRMFGALLTFLAITISVCAQSYSIDWFKVSGGGGTSTNGQFSLSGTIGQHDAGGPMTGGNYSLTGGFWSLISVVQTAGAPTLFISQSNNTVTVFWQNVSGWNLQQNANLALVNNWSASGGVTTSNGTNYLNAVNPSGNLFFRLTHS